MAHFPDCVLNITSPTWIEYAYHLKNFQSKPPKNLMYEQSSVSGQVNASPSASANLVIVSSDILPSNGLAAL